MDDLKELEEIFAETSRNGLNLTQAILFYMRKKVLEGRIESSEKMLELWTINGCPTASGCKYINGLEQQLKSEGK